MTSTNRDEKSSNLPLILSSGLFAGFIICYIVFPGFSESIKEAFDVLTSNDEARIAEWVSRFGAWGPVVIIVAMVLQMFFFIVPNILLIFISVVCYGPFWGAVIAWFGIFLASTVGYFIGNKLSPVTVRRFLSPKTQRRLQEFVKTYGMKAIIALRISSLSNDGLSLVAGLLNMKYRRFIVATLIGITPLITVIAIFGHGRIERALIYIGIFLVISLVTYIVIDKRRDKRKRTTT